jgi:hypothetical protein
MKALVFILLAASCAATFAADLKPEVIQWGVSAEKIRAAVTSQCKKGALERPIEPPFLPNVKTGQVQVDCSGFPFLGAPRWTEFVVGDDRLQMVWIMVRAEDKDAAVAALTEAYGPPSSRNEKYIAFKKGRAAWRHSPPEILFYAPELDTWVEPWFAE